MSITTLSSGLQLPSLGHSPWFDACNDNWTLLNDHLVGSGADHAYINQPVTSTSTPSFAGFAVGPITGNGYQTCYQASYSDIGWQGSYYAFRRYKGNVGAPAAVATGYTLGVFDFFGYDGSALMRAGQISSYVDGTVSTGIVPGQLWFSVASSAGSNTVSIKLRSDLSTEVKGRLKTQGGFELHAAGGAPSSPVAGQMYFNTSDGHFYGWNGSLWKQLDN